MDTSLCPRYSRRADIRRTDELANLDLSFVRRAEDVAVQLHEVLTTHDNLHGLSALVGIPGLPIAAVLISRSLACSRSWAAGRRLLLSTARLTWIALALMAATIAVTLPGNGGAFGPAGPAVPAGWPNRLLVIAYSAWLMVLARQATRLSRQES